MLRVGEAGEVARAIRTAIRKVQPPTASYPVRVGDDEVGQVCVFVSETNGAPWSPLGVLHADLALAANDLLEGSIRFDDELAFIDVQMSTIKDLFVVGPTHHLIGHLPGRERIGAFELNPVANPVDAIGPDRALWKADSRTQTHLVVSLTHKGTTPVGVGSDANRETMRQFRSTLFYARNMRWTSQALLAAVTAHPGMGGPTWTSLQHDDPNVLKAFALWANSTLGLLVHWTQGQRTHSGRSRTQIKALTNIPCPRLDEIPNARLDRAAAAFDELARAQLRPACQAHADEVRKKIDHVVLEMFGLASGEISDIVDTLRWLWCNEPTVHGQNRNALSLLKKTASA